VRYQRGKKGGIDKEKRKRKRERERERDGQRERKKEINKEHTDVWNKQKEDYTI